MTHFASPEVPLGAPERLDTKTTPNVKTPEQIYISILIQETCVGAHPVIPFAALRPDDGVNMQQILVTLTYDTSLLDATRKAKSK